MVLKAHGLLMARSIADPGADPRDRQVDGAPYREPQAHHVGWTASF
jgi:hypothetical protein